MGVSLAGARVGAFCTPLSLGAALCSALPYGMRHAPHADID
ncbi:MAG: hypothetical protein NZ455_03055 [Bacteroidia bacterium]|nr:hypothetical protein [Bacteroidia bacterium]MDW8347392.1 hypothetical protein [Bacteroidia bacterium]